MAAGALSIVIPSLNAARFLRATLGSLREGRPKEILVVDGGSDDGTAHLAQQEGCRVLSSLRGRGSQLVAGAAAAEGEWLLFLHADTELAPGWWAAVEDFMGRSENARRAAFFRFRLASTAPQARRVERLAAWRAWRLGLPYGDQGLLISRAFYEALGGYRPLPLMEDVELARRIGSGRLVALPVAAVTSASKYHRDGWWLRPACNLLLLAGYFLGVPLPLLARLYR